MPQHSHDLARLYRSFWGPRLDPAQPKLLPPLNGEGSGEKHGLAASELDAGVINAETKRRGRGGIPDERIAEIQPRLSVKKLPNLFERRLSQ
jgi:hypothetical protein